MSEAQTNPQGEVETPQLNMFDVMFGSDENTNPDQTIEKPVSTVESEEDLVSQLQEETEELEEAEELEATDNDQLEDEIGVEEEVDEAETHTTYTIKVDGEEHEVTLDELRNGYQRQADYTRKSQSLAEQRKAYEANLEAVQAERNQYVQVLENMSANQNAELQRFENINWQELKDTDTLEYMEKRLEYQEAKEKISELNNERYRVQQQNESEMATVLQEKIQKEAELLVQQLPEYANPDSNLKNDLRNYGIGLGFSEQEIDGITDHRVVMVLHKAMMQDQMSISPKKSKNVPKVVKSGTPQTKSQKAKKSVQAKRERLAKTGHHRDAANVFLDLLDS
tara:strand:- start:499 stop:1512 length:1014 start_codon:yes stop_codon:yes gene_type:complete